MLAGDWVHALRPVRMHLSSRFWTALPTGRPPTSASILAASILAEYGDTDPQFMPDELLPRSLLMRVPGNTRGCFRSSISEVRGWSIR